MTSHALYGKLMAEFRFMTDYVYNSRGRAVGYIRGRYVRSMNGRAVGQLNGTHVHRLRGDYIGELDRDMIVDKHLGNLGNIGNPGNPGMREIPATQAIAEC
jgi:hypothetical protein